MHQLLLNAAFLFALAQMLKNWSTFVCCILKMLQQFSALHLKLCSATENSKKSHLPYQCVLTRVLQKDDKKLNLLMRLLSTDLPEVNWKCENTFL